MRRPNTRLAMCGWMLLATSATGQTLDPSGDTAPPEQATQDPRELAGLYAEAVQAAVGRVSPALVQVRVIGDYRGLGRNASGAMSGVLLDPRWIITSSFGLERRPDVTVVAFANGDTRSASLTSIDHSRHTALLRLSEDAPFEAPPLEPRSDALPGETAIGVGVAYDPASPNVSVGVVSAANRRLGRAVQTDAAVSPANYGGLLVDLRGRVLGVLCPAGEPGDPAGGAEWYDSGIGFATPLEDILERLPRMQEGDDIHAGRAGLAFRPGNEYTEAPVVTAALKGGPGEKAGLQAGDRITSVDGESVANLKQFRIALGPHDAGDELTVGLLRGEQGLTLKLQLVAASELPRPEPRQPSMLERLKENLPQPE
ncbi:Periplasmic serine endoprotease DegP precursor [Posidoniimonas polymericola]|uniref:Periplasmic serine endoprotease DegP n=1 Tax=Posidoniimonas polymericola TaxID=2528002 RepID=A0A5C5YLJ6_9BACT|nr:S1C family serine protease [Posidoniimonas polymericola]TWT75823.1 Periplasmic serine endoprotease DegP precursor [Posidoniimonas polymericola]